MRGRARKSYPTPAGTGASSSLASRTVKTATITFGSTENETSKVRKSGLMPSGLVTATRKGGKPERRRSVIQSKHARDLAVLVSGQGAVLPGTRNNHAAVGLLTASATGASSSIPSSSAASALSAASSAVGGSSDADATPATLSTTTLSSQTVTGPLMTSSNTGTSSGLSSSSHSSSAHKSFAFRSDAERSRNPERLNLENRGLRRIPVLKGESESLRLLNLENNRVDSLSNLEFVPNLVFLDLYNNELRRIDGGLKSLRNLRVLMLGRNKIEQLAIDDLRFQSDLDVLDLHSNRLSQLTGIAHLTRLRVLNVAGNRLTDVRGLMPLTGLVELNLRRNRISQIPDSFAKHTRLERVLLSNNQISRVSDLIGLSEAPALKHLALSNNALLNNRGSSTDQSIAMVDNDNGQSNEDRVRDEIIFRFGHLTQLDSLNISLLHRAESESRCRERIAKNSGLKIGDTLENKSDSQGGNGSSSDGSSTTMTTASSSRDKSMLVERQSKLTSQKFGNISKEMSSMATTDRCGVMEGSSSLTSRRSANLVDLAAVAAANGTDQSPEQNTLENELIAQIRREWNERGQSTNFHSELSADQCTLACFGCGIPFEFADSFTQLTRVHLCCVDFDREIAPNLSEIPRHMPALTHLSFDWNNIQRLSQIHNFSVLADPPLRVNRVDLGAQEKSNDIVKSPLKLYSALLSRMLPYLQNVDGELITRETRLLMDSLHNIHQIQEGKQLITAEENISVISESNIDEEMKMSKQAIISSNNLGTESLSLQKTLSFLRKEAEKANEQRLKASVPQRRIVHEILHKSDCVARIHHRVSLLWPQIVDDLVQDVAADFAKLEEKPKFGHGYYFQNE